MPNRRGHDHIGNIRQKIGIRIGHDAATQVIANLKQLADLNITVRDIDKIVTNVIKNPKFLNSFIKNFKGAVKNLGIRVGDELPSG